MTITRPPLPSADVPADGGADVGRLETFTMKQVQQQTAAARLLVVYRQQVFDLTDFADTHPGGMELLLQHQGQDITALFHDPTSHSHSDSAAAILADYIVGRLDTPSSLDECAATERAAVDQHREFLDLSRPIMWQLWCKDIDKATYLHQVHIPRHTKGPARFFHSGFLEFFSRTPWWVIPLLWVPVAVVLMHFALLHESSASTVFLLLGLGTLGWSLMEYSLHRFVFHMDSAVPDNKIAIMAHFLLHGVHHFLPMDRYRLVFPPVMAIVIFAILYCSVSLVLPYGLKCAFAAGIVGGYIGYDMTHYYIHHGRPFSATLRSMKSYHMAHHYTRYDEGFGITSKFWDHVFGTLGAVHAAAAD